MAGRVGPPSSPGRAEREAALTHWCTRACASGAPCSKFLAENIENRKEKRYIYARALSHALI